MSTEDLFAEVNNRLRRLIESKHVTKRDVNKLLTRMIEDVDLLLTEEE